MNEEEDLIRISNAEMMGRVAERERIIKLLEPHRPTGKSVSGFLGVCSCGAVMDDYQEHLIALIKGEQK